MKVFFTDDTVISKTVDYIEKNLEKDLNLDQIAKEMNYSKFYLNRRFAQETGCTICKYIQTRRLGKAANMLTDTNLPIIEIAGEAGYGSQQAFTLAFRQAYRCTPQVYRTRTMHRGIQLVYHQKGGVMAA